MNKSLIIVVIMVSIIIAGCSQKTPDTQHYEDIYVNLNEEFILHLNQTAIIKDVDFEVKILEFYNSPCPRGAKCIWSGLGVELEYTHNGEVKKGMDIGLAFGYKIIIIETDYETFAKMIIEEE
ncbi:hypothetical protein HQ533_03160 [Candidatus Woesearchaeota archaeon]|nr:hypothetical protein [Candidatus Woesearchaeota archaeon]